CAVGWTPTASCGCGIAWRTASSCSGTRGGTAWTTAAAHPGLSAYFLNVSRGHAGIAVGKDHYHRLNFLLRDQVVDDDLGVANLGPFPIVPAQAMQQEQNRIFALGRIAGRQVNAELPARSERLRVVLKT